MSGSSCRPTRLVRFEGTAHAMSDGVAFRVNHLAEALEAYEAACRGPYRSAVFEIGDIVDAWRIGLRDLGTWTGDVGRAFIRADAVDRFTESDGTAADDRARAIEDFVPGRNPSFRDDPEAVVAFSDRTLRSFLPPSQQPYRGVPAGAPARFAFDLRGEEVDPDGPPAWISHLKTGGTYADLAGNLTKAAAGTLAELPSNATVLIELDPNFVAIFRNNQTVTTFAQTHLQARLRLPTASSTRLARAAKWLQHGSAAAAFTTSAHGQWTNDAHLPTDDRLIRSATRGGLVAGAGLGIGWAGGLLTSATVAPLCGPFAPLCAAGGAVAFGMAGGLLGDRLTSGLPFMQTTVKEQTEHTLEALEDRLANQDDRPVEPGLAATVDLAASGIALAEAAAEPALPDEVKPLLPDPSVLNRAVQGLPKVPVPTGTSTTTVTLATPSQGRAHDPWPSRRSYE